MASARLRIKKGDTLTPQEATCFHRAVVVHQGSAQHALAFEGPLLGDVQEDAPDFMCDHMCGGITTSAAGFAADFSGRFNGGGRCGKTKLP